MDPATACGPNLACPARGQAGKGNLRLHSRQEQRFLCTECHKTSSATQGTALSRLRTPAETVAFVVTLMTHGWPLHAIVVACGFDERTVASWLARAGVQSPAVPEHWVEHPRDLGQGQADAIRVKTHQGIVWMALAMVVYVYRRVTRGKRVEYREFLLSDLQRQYGSLAIGKYLDSVMLRKTFASRS